MSRCMKFKKNVVGRASTAFTYCTSHAGDTLPLSFRLNASLMACMSHMSSVALARTCVGVPVNSDSTDLHASTLSSS